MLSFYKFWCTDDHHITINMMIINMMAIDMIILMIIIMSKSYTSSSCCIASSASSVRSFITALIRFLSPTHLFLELQKLVGLGTWLSLDWILVKNLAISDKILLDGLRVTRLVGRNGRKTRLILWSTWNWGGPWQGETRGRFDRQPRHQGPRWRVACTPGPVDQVKSKFVISCPKWKKGPSSIKLSCLDGHWIYAALCNTNLLSIIIFQVIWRKGLQESPVRLLRSHSWPFSRIFTLFSLSDICLQFFFYRLEYEEECKWIRRWVAR